MNITPLHARTLTIDQTQIDLCTKYIQPFLWEGEFWVDGGWGPKNQIQDLFLGDPITGFKLPFYATPINELDPDTNRESNQRYHITFPGEQWKVLLYFIDALKEIGVNDMKLVVNSYFASVLPEEGEQIYQLCIQLKSEHTTLTIEKGKWIPNFEDSVSIAGWE